MTNIAPSQRCFGPYEPQPSKAKWNPPSHVRQCLNPAHPPHFIDTRTGVPYQPSNDGVLLVSKAMPPELRGNKRLWPYMSKISTCSAGHWHLRDTNEIMG